MPSDICSSCGKPVWRGPSSRPEIICHECRWEQRIVREAERSAIPAEERGRTAAQARWRGHEAKGYIPRSQLSPDQLAAERSRDKARYRGTCSTCGKPVSRGRTSRPEIICHECRRKQPRPYGLRSGTVDVYRDSSGKLRIDAICEQCGEPFKSRRNGHSSTGWTRYCSRTCVVKARGGIPGGSRHRWARMSEEARHRKRQRARQRHRAHQLTYDGVSDEQILERDGWRCRMDVCLYRSRNINPKYKYPDKRSASIDHIVPLSVSQDDTSFNKRAAHLGCNMARGAGRPGEQMALDFITTAPVVRERRKRVSKPQPPRPCRICGELTKGKCELHQPVRYGECRRCHAPMIKRGPMICQACTRCAADGCTARGDFGKGYCAPHYHRLNRYGDVFSDIPLAQDRLGRLEVAALIRLRMGIDRLPVVRASKPAEVGVCQLCEAYPLRTCCGQAS